jgi:hypothetical protein
MALPPGFVLEQPSTGIKLPPGFELEKPTPPPEKQSAFRQIADVPLGIAKGAVQGVRMIADAFGAGSDTSKTIKSAETYLADLMSAQAKNDQQEISRIMKDAEDKGVLDQVKAGIKAFTVAPVDTLSSALGTAAPVIAGALGAKLLGAGALATTGVSALTGAGMGAGTIKGSIYETTKQTLKEAGASEQDAEARAKLAQEYGGKNLDQILLGTVLGGAAAVGPLEKGGAAILARRILGKTEETVAGQAAKGAVRRRLEAGALEAVPEAVQAGQEQVAQNIALQREGFDVPTFRGAVSSATLEGLAGAGLGAAVGGGKPAEKPVEEKPAAETAAAPEVPPVTPEVEAPPVAEVPAAEAPAAPVAEAPVEPAVEVPPVAPVAEAPVAEAPPVEPVVEAAAPTPSAQERKSLGGKRSELGLYSELEKKIEAGSNKAPAASWKAYINGLTQKGVKPEEIESSGVKDWLDLQKGAVTKESLLNYLQQGGVKVEEVVLGRSPDAVIADRNAAYEAFERNEISIEERNRLIDAAGVKDTKYGQYALPGGTNYREVLLTLPVDRVDQSDSSYELNREASAAGLAALGFNGGEFAPERVKVDKPKYRSTHWDQPNVLAHIRVNDRTDADGKRVLFVEEIQSDWGQEGKKKGFATGALKAAEDAYMAEIDRLAEKYGVRKDATNKASAIRMAADKADLVRLIELNDKIVSEKAAVPSAPFVTKTEGWLNLALKRIMVMAAEGGYDKVAFVNGTQSAERYDLSKQIERITAYKETGGTYRISATDINGDTLPAQRAKDATELEGIVGKELAQKIADQKGVVESYSGLDLKVGGEGMKTFYNTIVPTALKKLLPKVGGGQMGVVKVDGIVRASTGNMEAGDFYDRQKNPDFKMLAQPGFDVTPAMREKVQTTGLPMFSKAGERSEQVQAFEQDLRTKLNKFGLKDVGLKILGGMTDSGSYAAQIIRIAADAANPVRTLRHEAIHALRELGFFTDAQWKSLSKMAKDKWIDQYLKQRNVDGKPLKAGEESRYDAYMREYNGDMEKITEEAVSDAFADFDATKPPAGLIQALLKRMKDLFQSIKSALTKVESPEQIFGKVEKGELKEGAREAKGEAKSLRDRATADIRKSIGGRNPGEQAISIVNSLGMGVKPPEPGRVEKAMKFLKDAGDNPSLTKESAKKTLTKWLDWFETTVFSSDSAFNNKIRRGIISDFKQNPEVLGMLLEASQSQTVHADALASQFMIDGGLQYNDDLKKWESVKKDDNFVALAKKIEDLATKYNVTKDEMERIAHTYFVAKRLPGIIKRNEELDAEIKAERATPKPDRKQIEEWESLKVFVSDEQLAMMEPGLSLAKTIPELKEVVDIWQGIRKNNIDVMVNSGLWSPEYANAMWDNMDYVPYYREEQLEEGAGPQEFIRGLQVKSAEFKLKGSGAAVNDVFDNMIRWSQYAMNRAIRAHKATQMIDAALKIEVDGKPMATKVTEQKRGMNIVRAFRDGKQELYDMADPLFVPAFSSIQNVSIPTLTFMAKLANVLRQSVVLYPLFSVAQVPQDSFAAMFSSGLKTQHALKIPYLAVKEFIKTLSKTSQTHNELKRFGVVGVRDFSATVIRDDAEIYAGLRPPKGGWGKTKEFLEHIAMSADNAVRQAVYEASMQQGLNKSEALEKAFEIINFRRRGTSKMLNVMGQTVPFFYAYLSAQRVAYRVLSGVGISPSERKEALTTLATTSAAVAALSVIYAMANGDDEDYAETPAAIRDRTLTIPGSGGVRIPLRPDFFLFPKIVAEHTYLMLSDQGFEDGAKFRKSMADALLSAVASPTPFPTAIKPAIEVAINYDFFQGKPLIGTFEKQKDIERQFRDSTSELAKILSNVPLSYSLEKGKFEGMSPIAIDHMIRGMLGSFGGLVLFGTNQFLHSDPDVPRPEMSANEMLAALPGTSGLLKRPQESALKNDFFVLRDAVEKAANTFNDIKTRSPEGIQAFLEDEKNAIRLGMAKGVDKVNRHLSDIRRRMTIITNMPESQMPADEKAENIRELRELEREILRSVNVKELREMAKI